MNIVFWLIVVIILAVVYFCGAFVFPRIGAVAVKAYNNFKKAISEEPQSHSNDTTETQEENSNEKG